MAITFTKAYHEFNKEMQSKKQNKMANQISKEKLVEYLKEKVEQYRSSMESYTTKGKYYHATEATYSAYHSLLTLVELGRFDDDTFSVSNLEKINLEISK